MKIEILTTFKEKKVKGGWCKEPDLIIKSINDHDFKAEYTYTPNGYCIALIDFKEMRK